MYSKLRSRFRVFAASVSDVATLGWQKCDKPGRLRAKPPLKSDHILARTFCLNSRQYLLRVGIRVAAQDKSSSDRRSPFFDSPLKGPELIRLKSIGYLRIQTEK